MRICFIGGGTMAEAIIRGIMIRGLVSPTEIIAADINPERCNFLNQAYGISTSSDNQEAIKGVDVIVLAVHPHSLKEIAEELKGRVQPEQIVLSILAGTAIATIAQGLPAEESKCA